MKEAIHSLRISFPGQPHVSVSAAREELSSFGAIASLGAPSCNEQHTAFVIVSYFDLCAKELAAATLGARCTQPGRHCMQSEEFEGGIELEASLVSNVAAIHYDEGDASRHASWAGAISDRSIVEAADIVVENTAKIQYAHTVRGAGSMKSLRRPSSTREKQALGNRAPLVGPRYMHSLRISEVNWSDIASGLEMRTTLRLRGLPRELGAPGALERMLADANLLDFIDCIRIHPPREGGRLGSALVNVASPEHVPAVARFFHGKPVGKSGPIAVSFATVQGAEALRQRTSPSDRVQVACPGFLVGPRRVEPLEHKTRGISEVSTDISEVSTDAGSCEDMDSMPDAVPSSHLEPCRVILPPPGLACKVQLGAV
jgi:hypothetical protein